MDTNQPMSLAPQQSSPASPHNDGASPLAGSTGSPQTPGSLSPHSAAAAARPMPAAVKAPWDDDDDDWDTPSPALPQHGQQQLQQSAMVPPPPPPAAPTQHADPSPALASATSPLELGSQPASPPEPRPTPQSMPDGNIDGFMSGSPVNASPMEGSPTQGSPNYPAPAPDKPSAAGAAKMETLEKEIAVRTTSIDAATKEKEAKIVAAAQEYIKVQKAKREKEVSEAKASHKQEQQAGTNKIDAYKKSGAVWNAVGMLVDLQKPNHYSKGTEQMRSILSTLNAAPAPAPTSAPVK